MSTDKKTIVIIMAGGMGKRMNSDLPKVLHKLAGISMMNRILLKLKVLSSSLIKIDKIIELPNFFPIIFKIKKGQYKIPPLQPN